MIPGNILKMLTNPAYFPSLDWKDQRRGLISISGEVDIDDVIRKIATPKNDFGTLIMVLNSGKKIEKHKDELAQKILKLKKEAVEFAPRIDEAKRGKPEARDWEVIQDVIARKATRIEQIDNLISDAVKALQEKQKGITAQRNELFKKQASLSEIRNTIRAKLQQDRSEGPNKISALKNQVSSVNNEIIRIENEIKLRTDNIEAYKKEIVRLDTLIAEHRNAWAEINAETFEFDESKCQCPTCRQSLPDDQIATQRETLQKNFNKSVADRKAEQVARADQRKKEKAQQEDMILSATAMVQSLEAEISNRQKKQAELNEQIDSLLKEQQGTVEENIEVVTDSLLEENPAAISLREEIRELEGYIKAATDALGEQDDHEEEKEEKRNLQAEIDELKNKLALKSVIEEADKRIQKLEAEEKATAQEIADLEQQIFDIDAYTRAEMDIVEQRVNGMFKYVRWRLFDKQVNGQIVETCVCEYNGVPYSTLNTAAKLLAGLDILNTLSNHYGIYAPVICDNRESVTWIPECKSQIISLFVSPQDKELRIEPASQSGQVRKAS